MEVERSARMISKGKADGGDNRTAEAAMEGQQETMRSKKAKRRKTVAAKEPPSTRFLLPRHTARKEWRTAKNEICGNWTNKQRIRCPHCKYDYQFPTGDKNWVCCNKCDATFVYAIINGLERVHWFDGLPGPNGNELKFPFRPNGEPRQRRIDGGSTGAPVLCLGMSQVRVDTIQGQIYNAPFRKKGKRKREKVDRISLVSPSPSKPKKALRKMVSVEEEDLGPLGPAPSEPHRITDQLGMTREEVISSLPEEMVDRFGDCGWASWKNVFRPVLILSPFDISGEGGMADEWTNTYLSGRNKRGTLSKKMRHLVYWYETGWSTSKGSKAFSLVGQVHSYETGVSNGWNKPSFANKDDGLTQYEDSILRGIQQAENDQRLPKNQRGGPLFFPELREKERKASRKVVNGLEKRYLSWEQSNNYKACVSHGISSRDDLGAVGVGGPVSLELCAGEGVMSQSLKRHGFVSAVTLDNDLKRSAVSQLSLAELESAIVNGRIHLHPDLNKTFSVIWAGPECRTWSRAQNGRYRTKDFLEGRGNRVLDVDAQQARLDVESMVNVFSFYKNRNPALVMVIENPVGYLHHHPVSDLFRSILGLELVKISYCRFSGGSNLYPQKDTHLWTNSGLLLHEFGSGEFECTPNLECVGRVDGKHMSRAQDLPGKCAAYPSSMCAFIAPLLFAEALKGTFGIRCEQKKTGRANKRVSTSSLSLSDDEAN